MLHPTTIISAKFEVDVTFFAELYSVLVVDTLRAWPCDLDLWRFDFRQWLFMAGDMANPFTKSEDPTRPFLSYELWRLL